MNPISRVDRDRHCHRAARRRGMGLLALALTACAVGAPSGCVEYRLLRYGYLSPARQEQVFPSRAISHADEPFVFARAREPRNDLDTITVRMWDGRRASFQEYLRVSRVRAFLVIRNDSILYERYFAGFTDSTRSGSYSMAKSFTSALLGIAIARHEIRALDDSVTAYAPDLRGNSALSGVTLRNALEMNTGLFYERMNGSSWHDLRSGDAEFYYTTDLEGALRGMHRAVAPGGAWSYSDADAQLIAWALIGATGESLSRQLEERIWRRIGTEFAASWSLDRSGGMEKAATGVNATARDYARFARLYLLGGAWNGEQVIPREWVRQSTTLDTLRPRANVGTWWRMQHRMYWWIPMQDWDRERDFFADGAKGQRLYVHQPSQTIIVQLSDSDDQDFPFRRITHYLLGDAYSYPVEPR
jgi:CubicO group peptidase (beta-lactamase class C family)